MNIPRRQNSRHFVSHKSRCRSIARDYHSKPVLDAEPHSRCQNFSNSLESHVSVNRRPGDRGSYRNPHFQGTPIRSAKGTLSGKPTTRAKC
jgi:hypothetical protein